MPERHRWGPATKRQLAVMLSIPIFVLASLPLRSGIVGHAAEPAPTTATLDLTVGYNFVSLPLVNLSFTASTFLNHIGNDAMSIATLDKVSGSYVTFDKSVAALGIPQTDFPIAPNEGYVVYASGQNTVDISGTLPSRRTVQLTPGYNLVGWTTNVESKAKSAFVDPSNGNVQSVSMFDPATDQFVVYDENLARFGFPQPDFAVSRGAAYFVYASNEVSLVYDDSPQTTTPTPTDPPIYLGAWLGSASYDEWTSQTGKGLAFYAIMSVFGQPDIRVPNTGAPHISLTQRVREALPRLDQGSYDAILLTWQTQYDGTDGASSQLECLRRVANGQYDSFLHENAKWIKANVRYPLYIRLNQEFNLGNWGWSRDPTAYVNAWRRVVDIFRAEGTNVVWVWCANWNDNGASRFTAYYPGDNYVDMIGVDVYANSWGGGVSAEQMLGWNNGAIYDFAVQRGKPFIIGEWGLNLTGDLSDQENADWLSGFFDAVEARPNVRAIIHWGGWGWALLAKGGSGVCRYPLTIEVYRNRVASSRYLASLTT